jgi:RsiW-degrading membrane proteinase PrsW (M82 family)
MSPLEGALIGIGAPSFMVVALERVFTVSRPPKSLILFFAGACTAFAALIGEEYAWSFFGASIFPQYAHLIQSFLLIALIEELAKLGLIYGQIVEGTLMSYREFAILAAWVGAGFAGGENVLYILGHGPDIVFFRIFTATPFHICNAIVASRLLWLAVLERKIEYAPIALVIAVFLHGLYDYLILTDSIEDGQFWFALAMTAAIAVGLMRRKEAT